MPRKRESTRVFRTERVLEVPHPHPVAVREGPACSKVNKLWNEETAAWFGGSNDEPKLGLLRFNATSAQGWGAGGSKLGALVEFVKAKVTGSRPSGQSGTTDLWQCTLWHAKGPGSR